MSKSGKNTGKRTGKNSGKQRVVRPENVQKSREEIQSAEELLNEAEEAAEAAAEDISGEAELMPEETEGEVEIFPVEEVNAVKEEETSAKEAAKKKAAETAAFANMPKDSFRNDKSSLVTFLADNKNVVMPAVLVLCVLVIALIATNANRGTAESGAAVNASASGSTYEIPETGMEENAYPEVNDLINRYYSAYAEGDIATIETLSSGLSDTAKLRMEEVAKHIESFPTLDVYTKPGPVENSYVAYVSEEMKFNDYEQPVPGMETLYLCTNEEGNLYVNAGEENESINDYIKQISLEPDVIDLNNKIATEYNNMIEGDKALSDLVTSFTTEINESVSRRLVELQGGDLAEAETSGEEAAGTESSTEDAGNEEGEEMIDVSGEETAAPTGGTIRAKDVVNIRRSDSQQSDTMGKTAIGNTYTLIEAQENGWSKIEYEGGTAFVKSEYFETVEVETAQETPQDSASNTATSGTETAGVNESSEAASAPSGTNTSSDASTTLLGAGNHHVKSTCRVRESRSTDAEIVITAYVGDNIEILQEYADGWTRVTYKGKTGYVRSEFLKE